MSKTLKTISSVLASAFMAMLCTVISASATQANGNVAQSFRVSQPSGMDSGNNLNGGGIQIQKGTPQNDSPELQEENHAPIIKTVDEAIAILNLDPTNIDAMVFLNQALEDNPELGNSLGIKVTSKQAIQAVGLDPKNIILQHSTSIAPFKTSIGHIPAWFVPDYQNNRIHAVSITGAGILGEIDVPEFAETSYQTEAVNRQALVVVVAAISLSPSRCDGTSNRWAPSWESFYRANMPIYLADSDIGFGMIYVPDANGRVAKSGSGQCYGYADWVYYRATGNHLPTCCNFGSLDTHHTQPGWVLQYPALPHSAIAFKVYYNSDGSTSAVDVIDSNFVGNPQGYNNLIGRHTFRWDSKNSSNLGKYAGYFQ